MDFGKKYKKKRILGNHKTWRGFVAGVIIAHVIYQLQIWLYSNPFFQNISLFDYSTMWGYIGLMMGMGALTGDAVKSFFKRQMRIKPGKSWIPLDQMDFTIGAILFASPWFFVGWTNAIVIVVLSIFLHMIVNYVGYLLKINKTKL